MIGAKNKLRYYLETLSPLYRGLIGSIAPGSAIFMFHRIVSEAEACYDSEMSTSPELFEAFLDWANDQYDVVGLDDLMKTKPKLNNRSKALCAITFDDGWRDVFDHAFPRLRARNMTATVFLPVRFVGTTRRFWQERVWFCLDELRRRNEVGPVLKRIILQFPWHPPLAAHEMNFERLRVVLGSRPSREADEFADRLEEQTGTRAVPPNAAFLDWTEVRAMRDGGICFGSHTLNHALLTCLDPTAASNEIEQSREELEGYLGAPVMGFSYPWGAQDARIRDQVQKAGYAFAVTTATKLVRDFGDPFSLPRLAISSAFLRGKNLRFDRRRMDFYIARTALRKNDARRVLWTRSPREKLRIGFVIDSIDAWEDGGTERQLAKLIQVLDRRYFEPVLYLLRPSQNLAKSDFPCAVHVASPRAGREWPRASVLYHLAELFRRHRPQIVQTFFRDGMYYGVVAARIAAVPVVVVSRRNTGYWKTSIDRLALKVINRQVDFWQCNSRAAYTSLAAESVPGAQIDILPNALDLSRFVRPSADERLSIRKRLGLSDSGPVVVSVANLTPVKDPGTMIKAAAAVNGAIDGATFLVIGEGPLRVQLQEQTREMGLTETIKFVGAQSDVLPFLAAADVGLLTSTSEGSSNSLLEYMAIGLPAVVSNIPANRELVDRVVFEPGNVGDLAKKIISLLEDRDLQDTVRRDYQERVAQYTQEAFAVRAQSFYINLASRRARKRL